MSRTIRSASKSFLTFSRGPRPRSLNAIVPHAPTSFRLSPSLLQKRYDSSMTAATIPVPAAALASPAPLQATRTTAKGATVYIDRLTAETGPEEMEEAAEVLAAAFQDHVSDAVNGDVPGLCLARMRATVTFSALDLEAFAARSEPGGKILAVLLAKPPGWEHGKYPHSDGPHKDKVLVLETPELHEAFSMIGDAFEQLEAEAFGPRRVTDTYYMSHLGVLPETQGTGIGSVMLRFGIERGKSWGQDMPVTLLTMTERHEKYYNTFGWKKKSEMKQVVRGIPIDWRCMSID